MGEALISRSGGGQVEAILPIVPGVCTLLVSVKDSLNRPAANIMVNCKDGNSWYNYTTNDKGQVMFSTNSGSANISVFNRFSNGRWILDQKSNTLNIDAPVSTSNKINVTFTGYAKNYELNFYRTGNTNDPPTAPSFPTGYYCFLVTNQIGVFVGGGGAGGSVKGLTVTGGDGGCAGGANDGIININKGQSYYGYLGVGGNGGYYYCGTSGESLGNSGGTSTFAGISAGGGSSTNCGSGKYMTGNRSNKNSELSNFGGSGGDSDREYDAVKPNCAYGGSPGGGEGGWSYLNDDDDQVIGGYPTSGKSGLGGGGGGAVYDYRTWQRGGNGGNGTIRIKFLD